MMRREYEGELRGPLRSLQQQIVNCRVCPRLVDHRERKATTEKRTIFKEWDYWGAPVPAHGDQLARLLIIGLAPASHGANRTGRLFTGDRTADFLTAALYRAGFASQPTSINRHDNLQLVDVFETAVIRCAPPNDKPQLAELSSCRKFLVQELGLLKSVRAVLALGRVAFDNYLRAIEESTGRKFTLKFLHQGKFDLGDQLPVLFSSYHPSPRNTNTGRLTKEALDSVLSDVRHFLQ